MFCRKCGRSLNQGDSFCPTCGAPVERREHRGGKNRIAAGLLALFLGSLGIHNFYLGHRQKGLTQLLISTVGGLFSCGISTLAMQIWALVEATRLFSGSVNLDAGGELLQD